MAAKGTKQISSLKSRIENVINKVDIEKLDFGEIKMNEKTNEFVLENETEVEALSQYLRSFIDDLEEGKEKIKQEKINEKLVKELNNGGNNASLIAEIFNK